VETDRSVLPLVRPARGHPAPLDVAQLYRQVEGELLRYAARLLPGDGAEDVVQEAVLKFLVQQDRLGGALTAHDARLRLLAMVKDAARDRMRSTRRQSRLMQLITGPTATIRRWMRAGQAVNDATILLAIRDAMDQMKPSDREVWVMMHEHGLTVADTANHLGISRGTCRAAIASANKVLRGELARLGVTPDTIGMREAP
jgi:RNA polymerase sigma factor (sigma-70 family)